MAYTMDVEIELVVECGVCGNSLGVTDHDFYRGTYRMEVTPCQACIDAAVDDAEKAAGEQ